MSGCVSAFGGYCGVDDAHCLFFFLVLVRGMDGALVLLGRVKGRVLCCVCVCDEGWGFEGGRWAEENMGFYSF